jgi:phage major head subunit gpT-like protein
MLTSSAIVTAEKIMRTLYNQTLLAWDMDNPFEQLLPLATEIPSTGAEEDYRWLQEMPIFAEWLGDLTVSDLSNYAYTLRNQHFAAGVGIDRDELEDDKWGMITPRLQGLAARAKLHRAKLIHNLILNATSNLAYDGIAVIADPTGVRVNDNLLAGTISAASPTVAQAEADIRTMRNAMLAFVDGRGETLGFTPDVFVVPPNLELLFRTIVGSPSDPALSGNGQFNAFRGIAEVVVDPALTDANDFYGLCTRWPVKPFVYQNRKDVELELVEQKLNKKLVFKADYRGAVGYSFPALIAKCVSAVG